MIAVTINNRCNDYEERIRRSVLSLCYHGPDGDCCDEITDENAKRQIRRKYKQQEDEERLAKAIAAQQSDWTKDNNDEAVIW